MYALADLAVPVVVPRAAPTQRRTPLGQTCSSDGDRGASRRPIRRGIAFNGVAQGLTLATGASLARLRHVPTELWFASGAERLTVKPRYTESRRFR